MIVTQKIQPLCKYINRATLNCPLSTRSDRPKERTVKYTTYCRPSFNSDKTVKVDSDLKTDIK